MKGNGYENHYRSIAPPTEGLRVQGSNLTKLARNKSKLPFNCDHCGLAYETYACWAKRYSNHYCSRACASAAKVIRFPKDCAICGTEMLITPSDYPKVFTCSTPCMRRKRVTNNVNTRTSPDYTAIAKRLKKDALCKSCGTTNGPWAVRGVRLWVEDGLACADGSEAYLVCRHCHLKSVAPLSTASAYMSDRFKYYKEKNTC
jgi:hypothetical protein